MKHIQSFNSYNGVNEEVKIPGKDFDLDDIIDLIVRSSEEYDKNDLKKIMKDIQYDEDKHEVAKILTDFTKGDIKIVFNDHTGYFNLSYDKQSSLDDYKYDKFKYGLKYE